ncbi:{ManC} Mannose-1-phosphate guanylyltransferase [Rhabdaerophilaceae bacterium]
MVSIREFLRVAPWLVHFQGVDKRFLIDCMQAMMSSVSTSRPLVALILCGGGGTRLWPISTEGRPKQFLPLFQQETLFQMTVKRLAAVGADHIVVLTNVALEALARSDLAAIGQTGVSFVLEPARRDSGPAIAAGMADVRARFGDDADVLIVASDHLIPDHAAFGASVTRARVLGRAGYLVTFGVRPNYPATEYGYIQRGEPVAGVEIGHRVNRFHEKPTIDKAQAYIADPEFAWNSGNFLFPVGVFAEQSEALMPDIWQAAHDAVAQGTRHGDQLLLDATCFSSARRISIDFALMERSDRVGVVPADFAWSDIGNWGSVYAASEKNSAGMALHGPVVAKECAYTLLHSEGPPIFAVGLDGFVVIASPNGVFIAPKSRASEIKTMLDAASQRS